MIVLIGLSVLFAAYFWLDCYQKSKIKQNQFLLSQKLKAAINGE